MQSFLQREIQWSKVSQPRIRALSCEIGVVVKSKSSSFQKSAPERPARRNNKCFKACLSQQLFGEKESQSSVSKKKTHSEQKADLILLSGNGNE